MLRRLRDCVPPKNPPGTLEAMTPAIPARRRGSEDADPTWRTRLGVRLAKRRAEIAVDQIRTISKGRVRKKLGALSASEAAALRRLITEMYGE